MEDADAVFDEPLTGLKQAEWIERFADVVGKYGHYRTLDDSHRSALLERSNTLLVTFETVEGLRALSKTAQPFGWTFARTHGWSQLCILSNGDTWFRSEAVYAYFDGLIDDGFFDEYDRVVFYGAGPCGYAAAAYSVSAPGARVLLVQPQATLDPRVTEWDDRFTEHRREDFSSRFGFAPDMIDAAERVYVVYDPNETLDAMHAALFTRGNVTKLRMRHFGATVQSALLGMGMLPGMLEGVESGDLDDVTFAKLFRRRRNNRHYLRTVLMHCTRTERLGLGRMLASNVVGRMTAPFFRNWLKAHPAATGEAETEVLPPEHDTRDDKTA